MRRREFIMLVGSAVGALVPLAAYAQSVEPKRRIGVLMGLAENDPASKARLAAFRKGLEQFGWSDGRSVHIDYRYAPAASAEGARPFAKS